VNDPHLEARGLFTRLDHPVVGRQTHAGIPWILTNGKNGVRSPAPLLGADTHSVLSELLKYTDEEIHLLEEEKVLY
jgi:crotonobetainyl-CoA:carnitine CoA-transferase CaiB-like acyl-CoA transferase